MVDYTEGKGYQYHTHTDSKNVGKYVIATGDPGRCKLIAGRFDNSQLVASNREYVTYTGELCETKVTVISTGIGGPSAAIAFEELKKCGVHTIIRVGTCGGIQLEVQGGDLVIASGAIRMEGTTKEYVPLEFPAIANFEVVQSLALAAHAKGMNHHIGVVECKDSFYGEMNPSEFPVGYELSLKWEAWKKCGALASEMESAALFIFGSFRKCRTGTILLVLDNQEREKAGLTNIQNHEINRAVDVAIDALKSLIEKDKKYGRNYSKS